MSGVGLIYDLRAIDRLEERIQAIAGFDRRKLLDVIGATVESQTRRRIQEDKTDPEGVKWPAWSKGYAETRGKGKSLLEGEGHLLDSLGYYGSDDDVEIGSNLIYAAIHQMGSGDEPAKVPAHKRTISQAFGRPLPSPKEVDVKAYTFLQNIPARAYLGLSADDEAEVEEVVDDFIARAIK